MLSAYLRLLIFLLAILIPACPSPSPAFLMMNSAYKLNKQPWCIPFPIWNQSFVSCPVLTVASSSSSNCYLYAAATATAAKLLQLCLTLCDPIDSSPPGSPVPGILQARTLEWVVISFSNAWKWKLKVKSLNRVQPSATSWTAAYQAPPSVGFSRQEYWSRVPSLSPASSLGIV